MIVSEKPRRSRSKKTEAQADVAPVVNETPTETAPPVETKKKSRTVEVFTLSAGQHFHSQDLNVYGTVIKVTDARVRVSINGKEQDWARTTPVKRCDALPEAQTTPKEEGGEQTVAKRPSQKVERDAFGSSENSVSFKMNAAIVEEFRTAEEVAKASGANLSRVKGHFKWLEKRGVVELSDGKARRLKGAKKEEPKKEKEEQVLGMDISALFRGAGAKKIPFKSTLLAVETITGKSLRSKEAPLELHYKAGKKGTDKYGPVPELTAEQVKKLKDSADA